MILKSCDVWGDALWSLVHLCNENIYSKGSHTYQVSRGLLYQFLQVGNVKLTGLDVQVLRDLEMFPVYSFLRFKLFLSHVTEPLQLLPLHLVQFGSYTVTEEF